MTRYQIVAINVKTGKRTRVTRYPMPHDIACHYLGLFTKHACSRLMLVPVRYL